MSNKKSRTVQPQRKIWSEPQVTSLNIALDDIENAFGAGLDGPTEVGFSMS